MAIARSNEKQPWEGKIGNHFGIGGIEGAVLDDGAGRGTRIAWVNTGSGLRYKVVIDRCMDIADALFNQHSLAWISHAGVTASRPDANRGFEWLYTFGGGLLATCGLSHIGEPEDDVDVDGAGMCTVGVDNPRLKLGLMLRYKKKQLPWLTNWQHWGYGEYVTALEPGTNPPTGQDQARKDKALIYLKPGESRSYDLEFEVLTGTGTCRKT